MLTFLTVLLSFYLATPSNQKQNCFGVPIGVVELPQQHIHSFRLVLQEIFQLQSIQFRGIDKNQDDPVATIHVPPLVASSLDDNHPKLCQFLQEHSGHYLSGIRRTCPTVNLPPPPQIDDNYSFSFVELFAGIGGFRLGLEQIGGGCFLANEVNPEAAAIYQQQNFAKDRLAVGDILDLDTANLMDFDCLVGGFPCQPFTKRGTQPGLMDDRGQLYQELARILHDKQPNCFLFENVPGLVTLQGGSRVVLEKGTLPVFQSGVVLERILDTFRACGYQVDWQVLNSRKWLPQMRERLYIVGTRNDLKARPMKWDDLILKQLQDESPVTVRDILEPKDSPSVVASELTTQQHDKLQQDVAKRKTQIGTIDLDGKAPTLISRYHSVSSVTTKFVLEEADGTVRERPRFLTPRECTRLMGFPDDFVVPDNKDKVATAHYYQAIGNAVCPIVIASIAKELIASLGEE